MDVVIFIGIPGSGKSTFYKETFFDSHIRINLDMLRSRHRELVLLHACMDAQQPCVVDNTNLTIETRSRYITLIKPAHCPIVGYYFTTDLQSAMDRNNLRSGKAQVPEQVLRSMYRRLQPPSLQEGFERLYQVELTAGAFHVLPWSR